MIRPRPQRIFPLAPIGSLLKRAPELPQRHRFAAGQDEGGDAQYLENIRRLPCLYCGVEPCGEAAHVRLASAAFGKASGLQKKPLDKWALPVCGNDHRVARHAQHNRSEADFWASIGISPLPLCQQLYAQRNDFVAMHAVVMVAIAGRSKLP